MLEFVYLVFTRFECSFLHFKYIAFFTRFECTLGQFLRGLEVEFNTILFFTSTPGGNGKTETLWILGVSQKYTRFECSFRKTSTQKML